MRYYDPQNGKLITNFYEYINDIKLDRGINILRVDNLRVDVNWASKIVERSGAAAKSGSLASGGTIGNIKADVADYIKKRNSAESMKEKVALDIDIVKRGNFIRSDYHSRANGSIFATEELPKKISGENLELSKNIQMAKKMADNGFDVYLLSNPQSSKSADFIFVKDGKVYYTEGKLSSGKNSLDHNLSKGSSQSERILVDMTGTADTNYITHQIKKAFESNSNLKEIMLLKGSRLISVKELMVTRKDYERYFRRLWEYKK